MFQKIAYASFLFFLIMTSYAQEADDVLGRWYTEENKAIVEVYPCKDAYCGKIVWLGRKSEDGKPLKDINNPDPALKERTIIGTDILQDLEYSGDGAYEDGKIYDPESGKTYSCLMRLQGNDQLEVRGFVGFSLIGRSTQWTRTNDQRGL